MNHPNLPPDLLRQLEQVFVRCKGLRQVWLFGSRARGTARPNSDVDLAVDWPGAGMLDLARLKGRLEELPVPVFFDLVDWAALEPGALKDEIDQQGQLIWALDA